MRARDTRPLAALLRRGALVVAGALLLPMLAASQDVQRPRLPDGADGNDWEAYYDYGISILPRYPERAEAAFLWASRLDPTRAEPPYARWVAFWMRDVERYQGYLREDERILRDPAVLAMESLRAMALRRNPFVHQGLLMLAYDRLPGRWREDALTRAWLAYGRANIPQALAKFGELIERNPARYGYLRFNRAAAFVGVAQFDSASAQIDSLLAQLRRRDEAVVGNGYESKELLEYAAGLLHLARQRPSEAREAFARALLENTGFAPAHGKLGELALASGDSATALMELSLAVELDPNDPILQMGYGRALFAARPPADAVPPLRRAVTLAPYYAEPRLYLAVALESAGDAAAARGAYGEFLERAKRTDGRRAYAEEKVKALAPAVGR